jgi:hypothetical protein
MWTAFIDLRVDYNWMQIVTADVAIFLVRLKILSPLYCDICRKIVLFPDKLDSRLLFALQVNGRSATLEPEGPSPSGSGEQPVQNSLTIGVEFDVLANAGTRKSGVSQDPSSTPSHATGETVLTTRNSPLGRGKKDRSRSKVAGEEHNRLIHQNLAGAGRHKRDRRGYGGPGRFLVHGKEGLVTYVAGEKSPVFSIPEKSA